MKKVLILIFGLVLCLTLCVACSEEDTIDENEAISKAKYSNETADQLSLLLGFSSYEKPIYTYSSAQKNSDGDWTIVLEGKMSGYKFSDKYRENKITKEFRYTTTVTDWGSVLRGDLID
ncbi:MAG: hypothetical protein J6D09_00435 [Clostridia bacterium]|nr:hypothetical protein [Clostridia bacterium]